MHDALDRAWTATPGTPLTLTIVDAKPIVALISMPVRDRLFQDFLDRLRQRLGSRSWLAGRGRKRRCPPLRRQLCAMERLAHVNVAEPGDNALIRERGFQRGLLAFEGPREGRRVEAAIERLWTEGLQRAITGLFAGVDDVHLTEAARIVEHDGGAGRHREQHVVVRIEAAAFVVEVTLHRIALPLDDAKRSRHAEVHQQRVA